MKAKGKTFELVLPRRKVRLPSSIISNTVLQTNRMIRRYASVNKRLPFFDLLGLRNLSSFIGELFASMLETTPGGVLQKNPHQDGYPDILLLDSVGRRQWNKTINSGSKDCFSPFSSGGIEVKATCGNTPTEKECRLQGFEKPGIGARRLPYLRGIDWKAHHRDTNNLLGLFWDFCNSIPQIEAVFFSSCLNQNDWGKLVIPKDGGGHTTSVSVMKKSGIQKMTSQCLYCRNKEYQEFFFEKYRTAFK